MTFKVFLINLTHSTERLAHCVKQLRALNINYERVEAVDGKLLSKADVTQFYDAAANKSLYRKDLSVGEIACYLSHRKVWAKIVDEELDYAVILEDDFTLNEGFINFPRVMSKLHNWDYIRLANYAAKYKVDERSPIDEDYDILHFAKIPINTLAQAVSYKGAKRLLETTSPFARPIDIDLKHFWDKGIDLLGINPILVQSTNKFESDISAMAAEKGREESSKAIRSARYLLNYKIKNGRFKKSRPSLRKYLVEIE